MCSLDIWISISWRPPASSSSSLIASTIASCCRSVCPHLPDGSGSPSRTGRPIRTLCIADGASLAWGLARRQFAFVAYAAVYGYVGVSSLFLRGVTDESAVLSYFVVSGVAMLVGLIQIGRRFGRPA